MITGDIQIILDVVKDLFLGVSIPTFGGIFLFRFKRQQEMYKAKMAERDVSSGYADEWKSLYETAKASNDELRGAIHSRESKIDKLEASNFEQQGVIETLKLEKQRLEFMKCVKSLKCIDRDPPNEFLT